MSQSGNGYTKNVQKAYGGKITLYQLTSTQKQTWYFRFSNPMKTHQLIRKSSKQTSLSDAKRVAIDYYEELMVKARLGLETKRATIGYLVDRYADQLPRTGQAPARNAYENYWKRYWGDEDLYNIEDDAIHHFVKWRVQPKNYAMNRNSKWTSGKDSHGKGIHAVAKSTLQSELKYLRYFFRRAHNARLIARMPNEVVDYGNYDNVSILQTNKRRGRFTEAQLDVMESWRGGFQRAWASNIKREKAGKEATNPMFQGHTINRYDRTVFYMLITIAINCGIRPVEITKLRFCDFKYQEEDGQVFTYFNIRPEVAKKGRNRDRVGKPRQAILSNMEVMIERMNQYRYEWARYFGRDPIEDAPVDDCDYIFPNTRDITKPRQHAILIKNGLERISEQKGFVVHGNFIHAEHFPDGKAWKQNTLYSFRSAYMTRQLKHGTSIYHLSKNVGSSIKSITSAYAVDEARDYWKYFTAHVRDLRKRGK